MTEAVGTDEEFTIKALRGDITTEAAYDRVRASRMLQQDGTLPTALALALAYGDSQHSDDARRFERFDDSWNVEVDTDPETTEAFEQLMVKRGEQVQAALDGADNGVMFACIECGDDFPLCDVDDHQHPPAIGGVDPSIYFGREGLRAAKLADDIIDVGPLAYGIDDLMWSYANGVWRPDRHVVVNRSTALLGDRYRRSHGSNAEDVVRSRSPRITCDPITEMINFRNGLYMWQPDQLSPHDPNVLSTVQLAVDWNPDATCPAFDAFLAQVLPEDMVPLMWEAIGYLLYSGNPLHRAYMLMGGGRNGKGTLLRVLGAAIGPGNFTAVSLHSLVNTRFSTANLFGKLANIAGDIDGTYLESTAMFKAITGQDQITAEHKGRDAFDFTPWAVPVFSANKVPPSADVTTGYLSRWLVIPFPNDFTGREDRHLDEQLQTKSELQGIAAKAMPALRTLMGRGDFDLPGSATEARDEFARRVDQVRMWVTDSCKVGETEWFSSRTGLYRSYKDWAGRDGHKPVKASEFYDRLEAVPSCQSTRRGSDGTRGFSGIKVTDDALKAPWDD